MSFPFLQLTYHATGRESRENPRMGQWNMINKVRWWLFGCVAGYLIPVYYNCSIPLTLFSLKIL